MRFWYKKSLLKFMFRKMLDGSVTIVTLVKQSRVMDCQVGGKWNSVRGILDIVIAVKTDGRFR